MTADTGSIPKKSFHQLFFEAFFVMVNVECRNAIAQFLFMGASKCGQFFAISGNNVRDGDTTLFKHCLKPGSF